MDRRGIFLFTQEFEDENCLDLEKKHIDFWTDLTEQCFDFRRNFPSFDDDCCHLAFNDNCLIKSNMNNVGGDNNEENKYSEIPRKQNQPSLNNTTTVNQKDVLEKIIPQDHQKEIESQEETIKTKAPKSGRKVKSLNVRWKKENDREMFSSLCSLSQQSNICIQDELNKWHFSNNFKDLLNQIKVMHDWKGSIYVLRKRIKQIFRKSVLTQRDKRELKRLLRDEANGLITMADVLNYFPGKPHDLIFDFKSRNDAKKGN